MGVGEAAGGHGEAAVGIGGGHWVNTGILTSQPIFLTAVPMSLLLTSIHMESLSITDFHNSLYKVFLFHICL